MRIARRIQKCIVFALAHYAPVSISYQDRHPEGIAPNLLLPFSWFNAHLLRVDHGGSKTWVRGGPERIADRNYPEQKIIDGGIPSYRANGKICWLPV